MHRTHETPLSVTTNADAPTADPDSALLDMKAAAAWLNVSTRTLWSMAASGEIPVVRIRRRRLFDRADLRRYIDAAKREVGR